MPILRIVVENPSWMGNSDRGKSEMRDFRGWRWGVLLTALSGVMPLQLCAQTLPPPGLARQSAPVATRQYVAIMGQVQRAGVYEVHSSNPELAEIVAFAGGLATDASGSIRLVRD